MTDDIDNDATTLHESGGVVQPTDAQFDPLDDLHGLLFLAQRTEGEQREAAISNARIVLHKFREAMVAVPQAPLQAEPVATVRIEYEGGHQWPVAEFSDLDIADGAKLYATPPAEPVPVVASDKLYRRVPVYGGHGHITEKYEPIATPQAEPAVAEPEPFAYWVYIPAEQRGELVHTLDEAMDDLTNCECQVTNLYDHPAPEPAVAEQTREALEAYGRMMYDAGMDAASDFRDRHREGEAKEQDAAEMLDAYLASQSTPPPAAEQARFFEGYLCRAWGETDLSAAEVVPDMEGVRRFMVREWLGEENATGYDGTPTLPPILEEIESRDWRDEGVYSIEFEIGGVSVERVTGTLASQSTPPPESAGQGLSDAARYQLLRRGQHFSVINGIGDTLRAEALDAAIDQALAGGAAK